MRKFLCFTLMAFLLFVSFGVSAAPAAIELPSNAVSNGQFGQEDADTFITLTGDTARINGEGAVFSDNTLTISSSGKYALTGHFSGKIVIDSSDPDKVTLLLNGVDLSTLNSSALLILSCEKNVTISPVKDSINLIRTTFLTDVLTQDGAYDAAIYSKADLKFKGDGALYISCEGGKGVNCRDDLELLSSQLFVTATDDGLRGKDSVSISGGDVRISAGADGIRSSNDETAGKGFITLSDGQVHIEAALDGVQAYGTLTVSGGDITIVTADGAGEVSVSREKGFGGGGPFGGGPFSGGKGGRGWDMDDDSSAHESTKGLKSDTEILITGGNIHANCLDDAIHSNQNVTINGGTLHLASGDDGIHADQALYLQGGDILVSQSYEGIEAADLQVSGGVIRVYASDDGVNAAGGEISASQTNGNKGFGGGRGGFGMLSSSSGNMKMSGGYLLVNSTGDGVDVNGSVDMTGGTLIIYGPSSSGNAALDYDETFLVSGGTLLATGSSGMAQAVTTSGEAQMLAFTCSIQQNTLIHITDEQNNEIVTFVSPKSYSCVVLAGDVLSSAAECFVYAEGSYSQQNDDGFLTGGVYTPGTLLGSLKP